MKKPFPRMPEMAFQGIKFSTWNSMCGCLNIKFINIKLTKTISNAVILTAAQTLSLTL